MRSVMFETVPYPAAHTYIADIQECPRPPALYVSIALAIAGVILWNSHPESLRQLKRLLKEIYKAQYPWKAAFLFNYFFYF